MSGEVLNQQEIVSQIESIPDIEYTNSKGWMNLKCRCCNDYKTRAGFKIESDKVIYKCFRGRCQVTNVYKFGDKPSSYTVELFRIYDIDFNGELLSSVSDNEGKALDKRYYEKPEYEYIEFPDTVKKLSSSSFASILDSYLIPRTIRKKLYYDTNEKKILVPVYYNGDIVAARYLCIGKDSKGKRFLFDKPYSTNDSISYILTHHIDEDIKSEMFITPDLLTCLSVPNSACIFQSNISKVQAYMLHNSSPVVIPSNNGYGMELIEKARIYRFKVSVPDYYGYRTLNEFVQKYGVSVAISNIYDNITNNFDNAKTKLSMELRER